MEIKKPEDWFDLSYRYCLGKLFEISRQMNTLGMHTVLKRYGGILPLLKKFYPGIVTFILALCRA